MATFDDSNDIKIKVTVDTESAAAAAKELGKAFENVAKTIGSDFKNLAAAAKSFSQAQIAQIKADSNEEIALIRERSAKRLAFFKEQLAKFKETQATERTQIEANAAEEVASLRKRQVAYKQYQMTRRAQIEAAYKEQIQTIQKETVSLKEAEKTKQAEIRATFSLATQTSKNQAKEAKIASDQKIAAIRAESATIKAELQKDIKTFQQIEATKRSELKKTTEEIRLEAAKVRQATAQAQLAGAGKAAAGLDASGIGSSLPKLAAGLYLAQSAANAVFGAISKVASSIVNLTREGERVQALTSAFNTLQQSVGRDPSASIERLRKATQGLISDTELYQKANQAVLLQVPTKLFEESAEAAVKLGRAMGIDAAFALESLSIGLGRQSRLYLDNLGIVVSASEAYRNFARENNIVGRELTETEKRLAFFNESSRKLREGLANLPPISDDVGTAFRKVSTTFQNLSDQFALGFNQNRALAQTFNDLNNVANALGPTLSRLGAIAAKLFSILGNIPVIRSTVNGLKELGTAAINTVDDLLNASTPEIKKRVSEIPAEIKKATDEITRYQNKAVKDPQGLQGAIYVFNRLVSEYGQLTTQLRDLESEANREIKLKVDTEEVVQATSDTETFIAALKKQTEESLGLIQIPGVDSSKLEGFKEQADALFLSIEQGGLKAQDAGVKIQELGIAIASAVNASNLAAFNAELNKTRDALSKTPQDEKLKVDVATLEKKIELLNKSAGLNQAEREQIQKFLKERERLVKDSFKKTSASVSGTSRQVVSELKKQQNELESFTKNLRRALEQAIPSNIQADLVAAFNDPKLSAEQLIQRIQQVGEEFLKAGGDVQAFIKEAGKLKDLKDQMPDAPIVQDAETTEQMRQAQEDLKQIQSQMLNIRKLFTDQEGGGGFFGFDTKDIVGPETQKQMQVALGEETFAGVEAAIAKKLIEVLQVGVRLAFEKFTRDDAPQIAEEIGTVLGGDIGGIIGKLIGENIRRNTQDLAGTKERKKIDAYFSELFDGGRLSIVIQGQLTGAINEATGEAIREAQPQIQRLSSLVFEGFTPFAGNVSFGGEGFTNYFNTLSTSIQASFNGVGLALGKLQGFATEQARLIGVALANNVGGSLQNLQVLVQLTGESFEDLSGAIIESFLNAELSIEEAYNSLIQLRNIYEEGIPGAVGAYAEAIDNFNQKLRDNAPGQYLVDSFRDIGAEAAEANKTFQDTVVEWATKANLSGQQVQLFFTALKQAGITNLQQLAGAGNEAVIFVLNAFKKIQDGTIQTTEQLQNLPVIPSIKPPSAPKSSGSKGKSPEQIAREKLREETKKLLRESIAYLDVLKKITDGEISRAQAGAEIVKLQTEIEEALKRRNRLEKALEEELDKGRKANKKRLADLASQLDAVNEKIGDFTKKAGESTKQFKQLNISGVIPFIKSANTLGVIAKQVGVSFEKATDILIQGFLKGRLSLAELNKELKSTRETLGPGIPNAVGAVTDAFQNLIDAGTQGGQFSVDAFTDIFAEYREKFQTENSALREAERKQLNENLTVAREAFANAVGPEATAAAKKTLDEAKKALDDFYAAAPAPDLAGLRSELERQFGADQVNLFFQALDESGLKTFEDFEKAGVDSIVGILGKLQSIGFQFNKTSEEILKANEELNNAEQAANGGLDPLQEAINLIKGLNEGAGQLPPVFNSTTKAVEGLNGPLAALKTGFDDIIEKLGLLSGQTYENDVVFNVRTVGDTGSKALVEIIFGDGANTTKDVAPTTSGNPKSGASKIAEWKAEIRRIQKLPSTERRKRRIAELRSRIAEAGG